MKKFYFLFFLFSYSFLFSQNLDWFYLTFKDKASTWSYINNLPKSFAIDQEENVIIAGHYFEKIGFDEQNPLNFQIVSPNGINNGNNCYLAKIDRTKKFLWSKTITRDNIGSSSITSVSIDSQGNIIAAGVVQGNNVNLNPGSTNPVLYNTSGNWSVTAIFIIKYSKNGDFIFGSYYKGGNGTPKVTTDSEDNIIVTGTYTNYGGVNTDFDLSDQEYYLSGYNGSSFILKNDKNGNFKWAKYVSGHNSTGINGVKTDHNDNIVFVGNNEAYFNFNGEINVPNFTSSNEEYIAKIDKNGNFIWHQRLGGDSLSQFFDTVSFDIDIDNSIAVTTTKINQPIPFPNKNLYIDNYSYRGLLIKIDENRNYLWHATISNTDYSQSNRPKTVSIASDHTVNWTTDGQGVYRIFDKNENSEEVKGWIHIYSYSSKDFEFLFKFNKDGKLIYNKYKFADHYIARSDNAKNKIYFAGFHPNSDQNPDQAIYSPPVLYEGDIRRGETFVQKLDKCYTATPDGDPFFYTCSSENKKLKDLYPKTSYSSWYDSPTSITPLSPETILETKKYYASTQDASCPYNPTRLEVDVRVFQNPADLVVSDFTFCNLQGKKLKDLNINNNQDVEFFDENMSSLGLLSPLQANKKYYVRQVKRYVINSYYYDWYCRSNLTSFFVFYTSVAPIINNLQTFCKFNNPKVSDIVVNGSNLKWYDAAGNIIANSTNLVDNTRYYVTQNSGTCESAKAEVLVRVNDPNPPTGNPIQVFCAAQNSTIQDLIVVGTDVKWYDSAGKLLPPTTLLVNNASYFATQTVSFCESTQKLAVKVELENNTLPANDHTEPPFCDENGNNTKHINLNNYKGKLIANPQDYDFKFYDSNNNLVQEVDLNLGITVFDVKITSNLGCFAWVKLSFTLNPKPKINLPEEVERCDGVDLFLNAGNDPKQTYLWSNGATTSEIKILTSGIYSVVVTNSFGCTATDSVLVKDVQTGEIKNIIIVNNNATVIMSNPGNYLFSLDQNNWSPSNVFANLVNGNHTVYVKTEGNCNVGRMNFTIFSIPNIITPNNDGVNDSWILTGIENYRNSKIKITDRFGNLVVDTITNGNFEWNGKVNGRPVPTGTYWYHMEISDGRILQGFLVVRNRN